MGHIRHGIDILLVLLPPDLLPGKVPPGNRLQLQEQFVLDLFPLGYGLLLILLGQLQCLLAQHILFDAFSVSVASVEVLGIGVLFHKGAAHGRATVVCVSH